VATGIPPWAKLLGVVAGVTALAGGGAALVNRVQDDREAEVVQDRTDDDEAIAGARSAVETRAPDAEITFGKTFVAWTGSVPSVCGEVDIVEEQDSFDGAERFIYTQGALLLEEIDGADPLARQWTAVCK
jgi:hypothetical protein